MTHTLGCNRIPSMLGMRDEKTGQPLTEERIVQEVGGLGRPEGTPSRADDRDGPPPLSEGRGHPKGQGYQNPSQAVDAPPGLTTPCSTPGDSGETVIPLRPIPFRPPLQKAPAQRFGAVGAVGVVVPSASAREASGDPVMGVGTPCFCLV